MYPAIDPAAARHANATEVQTQLYSDTIEIKLKITDNGTGISENTMNKKTLGLLGMRERALMIGANLTIQSQPGSGTVIELTIPFIPKET